MNSKGLFTVHWVFFGILFALGIFFMMTVDLDVGKAKGMWHLSFSHAFLESEKNMLFIDNQAQLIANDVLDNVGVNQFAADLGCGMYRGLAVWNNKDGFCEISLDEGLVRSFKEKLKVETGAEYEEFKIDGEQILAKTNEKKSIKSSLEVIPTETKYTNPIFSPSSNYQAFLIKPFPLEYYYNPSFKVKIEGNLALISELQKEAVTLVNECREERDLEKCLKKEKPDDKESEEWFFTYCGNNQYQEERRKTIFCSEGYSFGLDFTPDKPFSVDDLKITPGAVFTLEFSHDSIANSYLVYWTNWGSASNNLPKSASDIFLAMPTAVGFGYFNESLALPNPIVDNCPDQKKKGIPYLCGTKVVVLLDANENATHFAVTTKFGEDESLVTGFVSS